MTRSTYSGLIGIGIIIALLVITPITLYALGFYNEETVTATVTDKERITKQDNSYYLVFTDNEVFSVEDSWAKWRWDSSDLYGDIEIGKTYTFTVYGWRVPFLSWYRNILVIEEV